MAIDPDIQPLLDGKADLDHTHPIPDHSHPDLEARIAALEQTPPIPPVGVEIRLGDNIQQVLDAHPAGTTFTLLPGVYEKQTVNPKPGTTLNGVGAVLDGGGTTLKGIASPNNNIVVRGLEIRNYGVGNPDGHGIDCTSPTGEGWLIEDCYIHHNGGRGISAVYTRFVVRNNRITHNGRYGMAGGGWTSAHPKGVDGLIENNEIAFNNSDKYDYNNDAGATKFVHTVRLVLRGNHVHDNWGSGLWCDGSNSDTLYENNHVHDNRQNGIFHEINPAPATIRGNRVEDNQGFGVYIAASAGVEVTGNTVGINGNGAIVGSQENRGAALLEDLWVHHNTVTGPGVGVFVTGDPENQQAYTRNNRFDYNTYHLTDSKPFRWLNAHRTRAEWQSYGQDQHAIWDNNPPTVPFGFFLYGTSYDDQIGVESGGWISAQYSVGNVTRLEKAQQTGTRLFVSLAGASKNFGNPGFRLDDWKALVAEWANNYDLTPLIEDGTLAGHYLIDEPNSINVWGGSGVPFADIEEMARYSKLLWPELVTVVRCSPINLTKLPGYQPPFVWLDEGWVQYHSRFNSDPNYLTEQVRLAAVQQVGLVGGLQAVTGGDGSSGIHGPNHPNEWAMSPTELRTYGQQVIETLTPSGFLLWRWWDQTEWGYWQQPDTQTAVGYLRDLL